MLKILLLLSIFNFPILEVGDDAIGIFDVLMVVAIPMFLNSRLHKSNAFFLFFGTFFLLLAISTAINSLNNGLRFTDAIYLMKILELALIPIVVSNFLRSAARRHYDFASFDRFIIAVGFLLLLSSIYQLAILGWSRSGVPFVYGSSGPLGLIGAGLVIYAYFSRSLKYETITVGISICLLALSKSFLLAIASVLLYRFKYFFNFKFMLFVTAVLLIAWLGGGFITNRIESIIYAFQNFQELSSLNFRLTRHWFVLWDAHVSDLRLFVGGGVQSITLSFDSLYFYCFYSIGIFGSAILFLCGFFLSLKYEIFRLYFLVAMVSGIFLEASLISYRGLEPLLIFLTYANFTHQMRKYEERSYSSHSVL